MAPDAVATPAPPQKMSKGEKLYNWLVYSGLNYWVNLSSSLVIADYFTNLSGRKHLDKAINGVAKGLEKTGLLSAERAHHHSMHAMETLALTSGGTMLIPVLKPLEDNKRPIVHWLNELLGVKQVGANGRKLTPDEIYIEQEQPKQSWWNVIKRRIYAGIAIVGTGHLVQHTVGKKNVTDFVVKHTNKALKSGYVLGGHKIADNAVFQRYLGFAALDTLFTEINAVVMHITNGAKKNPQAAPQVAPEIPQPIPAPLKEEIAAVPTGQSHAERVRLRSDTPRKNIFDKPQSSRLSEKIAAQRRADEQDPTFLSV